MNLTTSAERAMTLVLSIPHKSCAKAAGSHWVVSPDGSVRTQAVLWLFCWAKTGMNSEEARAAAAQAFDEIFPFSFASLDSVIEHGYARKNRYNRLDIEEEFAAKLLRSGAVQTVSGPPNDRTRVCGYGIEPN